jgi:predicted PurR-regulated permease PerM
MARLLLSNFFKKLETQRITGDFMVKDTSSFVEFVKHVLFIVFILIIISVIIFYPSLMVLFFSAVLISVFVQGVAYWARDKIKLGYVTSVLLTLLIVLILFGGLGLLIGAPFVDQIDELKVSTINAWTTLLNQIRSTSLGDRILSMAPTMDELMERIPGGRLYGLFSGLVGAVSGIAIVVFIAIYLAIDPELYMRGVIALFPKKRQERVREILGLVAHALRYWMIGRVTAMFAVGLLTGLGLWIIGVPLPLSLGVLAGLLSFVPIIGPIVSAIPGILLAFSQSLSLAFYALLVYIIVQILEGNLITPMVQQRAVSLPPVLLLGAQALAAPMIGIVGVIFATPMLVSIIVIIQTAYVQDVLGQDIVPLGVRMRKQPK